MLTRPTTTAASSLPIPGSCPLSAAPCRDTRVSTTNRYFRVPAATATRLPVAQSDRTAFSKCRGNSGRAFASSPEKPKHARSLPTGIDQARDEHRDHGNTNDHN